MTLHAQISMPDTLFCGDTLVAVYDPAFGGSTTDSLFVWVGNCVPDVRFDFTTANVPDAADIFYVDLYGNITDAGSVPYFGGNCHNTGNFFNDSVTYPLQTSLDPGHCLPGFVEIYGRGIPWQDSIRRRNTLPTDFKLGGDWDEGARLHLDIPPGIIGILFVVKFQSGIYSSLEALWDCTPTCCITAEGSNVCSGDSILLNTEFPALAYQWTGPSGFTSTDRSPFIPQATPDYEGWYVVEGEYLFNCVGIDSVYVQVNSPDVNISPEKSYVCEGNSLILTATGAISYSWNQQTPGFTRINGGSATILPPDSLIYTVYGFDAFGCRDSSTATVVPTRTQANWAGEAPACHGEYNGKAIANILEGSAPFEVRLAGGVWQAGTMQNGLEAGSYQMEVRDARGCIATGNITLNDPEPVSAFIGSMDPHCTESCNGEVTIFAQGGNGMYSYFVDGMAVSSETGDLCAGDHSVRIMDGNGCEWTENFTLDEPEPFEIDLGRTRKVYLGEKVTLAVMSNEPLESVIWHSYCTDNCEYFLELEPDSSLMVFATARSPMGCEATDSVRIRVKVEARCNQEIYSPTAFSPNGDGLNDRFTIYADRESADVKIIDRLTIFNRWGNKVYDRGSMLLNDETSGWDGTYQGAGVQPGIYTWAATFLREDNARFECGGTVMVVR